MSTTVSINSSLKLYLPVFLWAALIFSLSSQSSLLSFEASVLDFIFKKSAHMFVFAVLYLLIFRAYYLSKGKNLSKRNYWLPLLLCLLYSAIDELHQSFVPGRHPAVRDIGYDMLGVLTVLLYQQNFI